MLRLNHGPDFCERAGHVDADRIFPRAIRSAIPVISVAFHAGVPPPLHFALTSATLIGPFLPAAPLPGAPHILTNLSSLKEQGLMHRSFRFVLPAVAALCIGAAAADLHAQGAPGAQGKTAEQVKKNIQALKGLPASQ